MMPELSDYSLAEVVYAGDETQVIRAVHRPSGARVAVKLPAAELPSARLLGRLIHEHEVPRASAEDPSGSLPWRNACAFPLFSLATRITSHAGSLVMKIGRAAELAASRLRRIGGQTGA